MYRIELINKKTKQVINYDDVVDLNDGEKMFFKFQINTKQLDDGEYTLNLYDDDTLIKTDTLNVGDFNAKALQYKRGEDIYVETKIDVELTNKFVELTDINSTIYPDDGIDGMLSVTVDATPLYNRGVEDGVNEQKNRLTSITITENGEYSNEDGYNEIVVEVQPNLQEKSVNVTDNNTTVTADEEFDGMKSVEINATPLYNSGYNDGKSDGVEQGYNNGYAVGSTEGYQNGVQVGYNDGYATGKAEGITTQRDLMTTLSVRSNGLWRRDDGYNEVDVNVESFSYLTNTVDVEGLSELGWSDDDINYYKDNSLHYEWQNKDYIVSQGNKEIVINSVDDIEQYRENPDFEYFPYFEITDSNLYYKFSSCKYLKGIPKLDFSKVTNLNNAFYNCESLLTIPPIDVSSATGLTATFLGCSNLKQVPMFDFPSATLVNGLFKGCKSLETVPCYDVSGVKDISAFFMDCSNLKQVPQFNVSSATNMASFVRNCTQLKEFPMIQTQTVSDFSSFFEGCVNLESVPQLDMTNGRNLSCFVKGCTKLTTFPMLDFQSTLVFIEEMFSGCENLITIPQLNFASAERSAKLFYGCKKLESVPDLDLGSSTDLSNSFYNCTNLKSIGKLKTQSVTNFGYLLYGCTNLQSIGLLDFTSAKNLGTVCGYSELKNLTDLGGFKNLKINWNDNNGLPKCPNLTKQSVLNVINNLYDFRANGDSTTTRTIKFHKNSLALLSDDEKAIATAKGWVLTS